MIFLRSSERFVVKGREILIHWQDVVDRKLRRKFRREILRQARESRYMQELASVEFEVGEFAHSRVSHLELNHGKNKAYINYLSEDTARSISHEVGHIWHAMKSQAFVDKGKVIEKHQKLLAAMASSKKRGYSRLLFYMEQMVFHIVLEGIAMYIELIEKLEMSFDHFAHYEAVALLETKEISEMFMGTLVSIRDGTNLYPTKQVIEKLKHSSYELEPML